MKIRIAITSLALALATTGAGARDITSILSEIEKGNLELQTLRLSNRAEDLETRSANTPEPPSVEYSPFFHRGASGVASSELVVSQEFDFPTLYSARGRSARLQAEVMEAGYLAARRDILLSAKEICLDIVMLDEQIGLAESRLDIARQLEQLTQRRLDAGETTAIEMNRVMIEKNDLQTELIQYRADREALAGRLAALNGGNAIDTGELAYTEEALPSDSDALSALLLDGDASVKSAEATLAAMRQEVKVARQGWIPKLTVGYRRNTDGSEASNGFLVGASFPIYSTGKKVKAAAVRQAAAQLDLENSRVALRSEAEALFGELRLIRQSLDIYDPALMQESLELLRKSVDIGNMTVTDYYTEADRIYQKKNSFITLRNRYQRLLARIHRNAL